MTKPMNKVLKAQFFVDDLSDDQKNVITNINDYIKQGLTGKQSSVAIIEGAAGTGKSVVLMELVRQYMTDKRYKTSLVVNHPELYKAYREMGTAIPNMNVSTIRRPTSLINYAQKNHEKYDIIFVDEAHLLYSKSEPYAHYRGQNQLTDLMNLAKVVVVVYDFEQVFQSKMYWDKDLLFKTIGNHPYKRFEMNFQYRMVASDEQVTWMNDLTEEKKSNHSLATVTSNSRSTIKLARCLRKLRRVTKNTV